MGMGMFSSGRSTPAPTDPRPDVFDILSLQEIGSLTIVKAFYPHCRNYNGLKILVYNVPANVVKKLTLLDPHFLEVGISPIARFIPTKAGYEMALMFCEEAAKHLNI